MSQIKKSATPAKFTFDTAVRVRAGITDPDFPEFPLGGWAGKIVEIEDRNPPHFLIRWSQETLRAVHPVYRQRCERLGFEFEEMWLGEDDLEPDTGGPVIVQPPTRIVTLPLSMKVQDDRIRMIFGMTRDGQLPNVEDASLRTYYKHLATTLTFPFEAIRAREAGPGEVTEKVTVLALGGFEDDPWIDDLHGILCKAKASRGACVFPLAELEKVKSKPDKQLVKDYAYWFWNFR